MSLPDFDTIRDTFDLLDDWDDRYAFLIDLGKKLPSYPDAARNDVHLVPGCTSQVWMIITRDEGGRLSLVADSDALIVRGLIAVLLSLFQGTTHDETQALDVDACFTQLGLNTHLSPNRRNGFFAMVEKLKQA